MLLEIPWVWVLIRHALLWQEVLTHAANKARLTSWGRVGEIIKQNRMASHLNLTFLVVVVIIAVVVTLDYNWVDWERSMQLLAGIPCVKLMRINLMTIRSWMANNKRLKWLAPLLQLELLVSPLLCALLSAAPEGCGWWKIVLRSRLQFFHHVTTNIKCHFKLSSEYVEWNLIPIEQFRNNQMHVAHDNALHQCTSQS